MKQPLQLRERYLGAVRQVSIFNRVLIGNSVIILFGAIAGTIITRQLTLFGNAWLILLFASVGVFITLLVNRAIIHSAMRPLRELGDALGQVNSEQINIPESLKAYQDPDIHRLIMAIDDMLNRLAERTRQLQAISERAINAQEEERVRIARSLHDDTAQSISSLIILLDRLAGKLPPDTPELAGYVANARGVATQLLDNLRDVIWDLRPSILDDLGLFAAVRWFARSKLEPAGVKVEFWESGTAIRMPSHLETMLFRISQEAINNILKHAHARNVEIRFWPDNSHICLEVRDNGRGFDMEKTAGSAVYRKQLGLLGIQERVTLVGGEMQLQSAQGEGTSLRVRIPLLIGHVTGDNEFETGPVTQLEEIARP